MNRRKILILGGAFHQVPVIEYARQKGLHVITADYLPGNPGHKLADEYYNISTVEKERILDLAQRLEIDAISAYASDPAAPTAAYVSERMGLVGSPFQAINTLTNKSLFRKFLNDNHFNCPWFVAGTTADELLAGYRGGRAVIKPVDSSGSKGIRELNSIGEVPGAFEFARQYSRSGTIILEQYLETDSPHMHGEGFVIDGKLVFLCLGDHFYSSTNPLAPLGTILPSIANAGIMAGMESLIGEIVQKVGFGTGGINVEAIRDKKGRIYVNEVGARNGGNFMPQYIKQACGFDLVKANVDALFKEAVNTECNFPRGDYFIQLILGPGKEGIYEGLYIPEEFRAEILEKHVRCRRGEHINKYVNSSDSLGVLVLRIKEKDMDRFRGILTNWEWVRVSQDGSFNTGKNG